MGEYTSWVQLTITALLLSLVFAAIRNDLKKTTETIEKYVDKEVERMANDVKIAHNRIDDANTERRNEYLLETKHALLCSNRMHELKEHVSTSMNAVFDAIRGLEKKIDQLDGRTGFMKDKP